MKFNIWEERIWDEKFDNWELESEKWEFFTKNKDKE